MKLYLVLTGAIKHSFISLDFFLGGGVLQNVIYDICGKSDPTDVVIHQEFRPVWAVTFSCFRISPPPVMTSLRALIWSQLFIAKGYRLILAYFRLISTDFRLILADFS